MLGTGKFDALRKSSAGRAKGAMLCHCRPAMPPPSLEQKQFEETRWSLISRAGGDDPSAQEALDDLCQRYWYPVYAFIRRSGQAPADAEDLTQDFFRRFFAEGSFLQASRERGKFRSYVLKAVKNQMISSQIRSQTIRRGGLAVRLSLDQVGAEARLNQHEFFEDVAPERLFDHEWAVTIVETVLQRLRAEYEHLDKEALFDALSDVIQGRPDSNFYTMTAERFGMTENAVRVAAHRLRVRYGSLLQQEVADLLDNPSSDQVREEIRYLFEALTST